MSGSNNFYEGLDDKMMTKIHSELNEDPRQVTAHIASLRRWLSSMPHLKCRDDDKFLLRFLRTAKFDQSRAQILLDNFCTVRSSPKGSPDWFAYMPIDDPKFTWYLDKTSPVYLGQTDEGCPVYFSSMEYYDPALVNMVDYIRCFYMFSDMMLADRFAQISGAIFLQEMKIVHPNTTKQWQNPKVMFKSMRNWQDAFPMRSKAMIYMNEPLSMDVIFNIVNLFMKEKFKRRMHRIGSNMDKLKQILGSNWENILPPEYGGKNKSLDELRKIQKEVFLSDKIEFERQENVKISVNEKLRPDESKSYLKTYEDKADPSMGIAGTFTKLNVD